MGEAAPEAWGEAELFESLSVIDAVRELPLTYI